MLVRLCRMRCLPCRSGDGSLRPLLASRRRRALGSVIAAALALVGVAEAFALGSRCTLPRGVLQRGDRCRACVLPERGSEDARPSSDVEAASSSLPAWAAAAAALCLLAAAVATPPMAARAAGPPPGGDSVQVVTEDGSVVGEDTVGDVEDMREAGKQRKGTESKPVPVIPEEERLRRRETPSGEVKDELWYKRGKIVFVAKCSGCHPAGTNTVALSKSLFWDDMERNGYRDFEKIKQIIRYGKGKMPGYAEDCASKQEYTQCGVISPVDEETLQEVEDFMINRANAGWKGRG